MRRSQSLSMLFIIALLCLALLALGCGKEKGGDGQPFDAKASADEAAVVIAQIQAANFTSASELFRLDDCGRRYDRNEVTAEFFKKIGQEYNQIFLSEAERRMTEAIKEELKDSPNLPRPELASNLNHVAEELMKDLARDIAERVPDYLLAYGCTRQTQSSAQQLVEDRFRLPTPYITTSPSGQLQFSWQR